MRNSRKSICLIIPSLQTGGMERVMVRLANYLSLKDLELHLVILTKNKRFYSTSEKVIIHEPDFINTNGSRILYIFRTLKYLRKKLKELKPNSILSFGEMYNSFVLMSALRLNLNVFISDRSKPDKNWGKIHELLRKKLYPLAKGIIAQTSFSKDFLKGITGHNNIRIIPNPIEPIPRVNSERENIILNIGRLIETKRIDILLDVFSQLNSPDWKLWIVGDGPKRNVLEKKARELNIDKKVKFWGNQKELSQFYSKSKIFAFTSVSEGFPNALLEASSYGLAIIAFDCVAGPKDILDHRINGILIKELDIKTYVEELKRIVDNSEEIKRLSENALNNTQRFLIENIGEKYLNFMLE